MNLTLKKGKLPYVPDERDLDIADLGLSPEAVKTTSADFGNYPLLFGETSPAESMFWDFNFPLGMYDNDRIGDCVPAFFAGGETLDSVEGSHPAIAFTDKGVESDYSAVTGYRPGEESTDRGTEVRAYLAYHRKTGILDASDKRRKIGAFAGFDPKDTEKLLAVVAALGKSPIGFEVPNYAMDQFNAKEPFDIKKNATVEEAEHEEGHCIGVLGLYKGYLVVRTWGTLALMSLAFYRKFNDESWAYYSTEFLNDGESISGLDKQKGLELVASLG